MGCRQALVGGRYALVELSGERRRLAPDFYLLLLWRQLMSPKVLRVVKAPSGSSGGPSQSGASAPADPEPARFHGAASWAASWTASWTERLAPHLRSYASCARSSVSLPG